jgi:CRISPR-associated exonuclease Cas4
MNIIAVHITYFHICHRKLWLFAHGITMEQTSDSVAEGKMIGETTYERRPEKFSEIEVGGSKIDFYDARNKVVHEVKKTDKLEEAHEAQVKYYIWLLEKFGIEGVTGVLEYPKLKKTLKVVLEDADRVNIPIWIREIEKIIQQEKCPPLVKKTICKSCSYYEFCYAGEED